jgi:DNA-binding transcriptional regulator YdaS (Cro superfamily)
MLAKPPNVSQNQAAVTTLVANGEAMLEKITVFPVLREAVALLPDKRVCCYLEAYDKANAAEKRL